MGQFAGESRCNDGQTIYRARNDHDFLFDRASAILNLSVEQSFFATIIAVGVNQVTFRKRQDYSFGRLRSAPVRAQLHPTRQPEQ